METFTSFTTVMGILAAVYGSFLYVLFHNGPLEGLKANTIWIVVGATTFVVDVLIYIIH